MPKYLVEREIPGAGGWSAEQRRKVAEKSNGVLRELGYGEAAIRELHARGIVVSP